MRVAMDDDIKTILARFERRLPKRVIGFMPAVPLYAFSQGVPEDGVLLRYLFPMSGTLTKLYVSVIGATSQRILTVRAELTEPSTGQYVEGVLRKDLTIIEASLEVIAGSRLTVLAAAMWDGPIEVAAIFIPKMGIGEQHTAMLDQLEQEQKEREEKQDERA